ncbi:MAG: hypothetical protein DRN15_03455 [Thermoprotei archaeon]|nr:MAG: hypothetical protein DRN15_03455 [Thermoprotei archaeon]RLF25405.1 MAG: hypothetical protein DRM97_01915 [Thermoprotei archaeon]
MLLRTPSLNLIISLVLFAAALAVVIPVIKRLLDAYMRAKGCENELPFITLIVTSYDGNPLLILYNMDKTMFKYFVKECHEWKSLRKWGMGPCEAILTSIANHPSLLYRDVMKRIIAYSRGLASPQELVRSIMSAWEEKVVKLDVHLEHLFNLLTTILLFIQPLALSLTVLLAGDTTMTITLPYLISALASLIAIGISTSIYPGILKFSTKWRHLTPLFLIIPLSFVITEFFNIALNLSLGLLIIVLSTPSAIMIYRCIKEDLVAVEELLKALEDTLSYAVRTGHTVSRSFVRVLKRKSFRTSPMQVFFHEMNYSIDRAFNLAIDKAHSAMVRYSFEAIRLLLKYSSRIGPIRDFLRAFKDMWHLHMKARAKLGTFIPYILLMLVLYTATVVIVIEVGAWLSELTKEVYLQHGNIPLSPMEIDDTLRELVYTSTIFTCLGLSFAVGALRDGDPRCGLMYLPMFTFMVLITQALLLTLGVIDTLLGR